LAADFGERFLEAFKTFFVVGGGVVEEGEQSLFEVAEALELVFVGKEDLGGRGFV